MAKISKFESWLKAKYPETYEGLMKELESDTTKTKIPFSTFWDTYAKKVGGKKAKTKWDSMTRIEQMKAMQPIEAYKEAEPNPKFRSNPLTYLNGEFWNDEGFIESKKGIEISKNKSVEGAKRNIGHWERIIQESQNH